jgi:HME family heavy-metal exporter
MFNQIIAWSLRYRFLVFLGAGVIAVLGLWSLFTMKVDILPDINKPTVTVFAAKPGLAAEEVERTILTPLESSLLGAPGVDRIRSNASFALATLNIEFAWGTDVLRDRQIVSERLAQATLPQGVTPVLGPSTSLIGEIMWVGMTSSDPSITPMQLHTLADWTVRPAILRVPALSSPVMRQPVRVQ